MIELGVLITSFQDTARACRVAAEKQDLVCLRNNSGQIAVIAAPGDNPHVLYKTYFAAMHDDNLLNDYYASRVAGNGGVGVEKNEPC